MAKTNIEKRPFLDEECSYQVDLSDGPEAVLRNLLSSYDNLISLLENIFLDEKDLDEKTKNGIKQIILKGLKSNYYQDSLQRFKDLADYMAYCGNIYDEEGNMIIPDASEFLKRINDINIEKMRCRHNMIVEEVLPKVLQSIEEVTVEEPQFFSVPAETSVTLKRLDSKPPYALSIDSRGYIGLNIYGTKRSNRIMFRTIKEFFESLEKKME